MLGFWGRLTAFLAGVALVGISMAESHGELSAMTALLVATTIVTTLTWAVENIDG